MAQENCAGRYFAIKLIYGWTGIQENSGKNLVG